MLGIIITAGQVDVAEILRRTVCAVKASIPFAPLQKHRVNVTTPFTKLHTVHNAMKQSL